MHKGTGRDHVVAKVAEANAGGMVRSYYILKHTDAIDEFRGHVARLVVQNVDAFLLELVV